MGDLVVQARCLAYLTVAYRRRGDVEATRSFAERGIALSQQLGTIEYVAMAKANLAWLAWRQSRSEDALLLGEEALTLWHGMDDPYGVDWQALLPLTAVAMQQDRLPAAVEYLRGLFRDNQHPLPAELATASQEAISGEFAAPKLERVIQVAKRIGYL